MMANGTKEKHWLVKSSTRILGPYSSDELVDLLQKKTISYLDEIRKPTGRWAFIRENKEISALLSEVEDFDPSELTVSMMTIGQTISRTENISDIEESDKAEVDPKEIFNKKTTEETIKDIVPIKEKVVTYNTAAAKPSNLTYGAYTEDQIKGAVESKAQLIRLILMVCVGVVVTGYFGYILFAKSKQSMNNQALLSTALRLKSIHLYEKAYDVYKKAKAQKEPDMATQAEMALLSIVFDNEAGATRSLLEKYMTSVDIKDRRQLVNYNIAIALSYLKEGDENKARENFLKAVGIDPFNQAVILNRSLMQIKKEEFRDSYINLKRVNSKDELMNLLLFVKTYTLIEMSKSTSVIADEIRELLIEIPNQLHKSGLLRSELLLLSIKLQLILNNEESFLSAVDRFLDSYPNYSKYIVKDPRINWKMTQWDVLDKICLELSQIHLAFRSKLLRARCLMESQNPVQAQKFLDEALAEAPKEALVINTQIYWLKMMNKDSELLSLAKKYEPLLNASSQSIVADVCLENRDEACFNQSLVKFSNNSALAPLYHYYVAQNAASKNKKAESLQSIKQGLTADALFLPLIELRENLESQQ